MTAERPAPTFSQSVEEMARQLRGRQWTPSQLLGKAQAYLQATGTKSPSKAMRAALANAVYARLLEVES